MVAAPKDGTQNNNKKPWEIIENIRSVYVGAELIVKPNISGNSLQI